MLRVKRAAVYGALATALLATAAAPATLASADSPAPGQAATEGTKGGHGDLSDAPLRKLAERTKTKVRIGTAVDMSALADDATYRETVAKEFNSVTAENVMKWEVVQPERGVYDFTAADALMKTARANGQEVRGHTLVWHSQLPAWVNEGDFSKEELRSILRDHITTVVKRYKGKIYQWDVANEIFNEDGTWRESVWYKTLGPGYVEDALRWTHAIDPKAKLFLNDYNVEGVNAKSDAYYELIKKLRAKGVPVHGFGAQGHLSLEYDLPHDMTENFLRFDRLGVETAVTEADVRMRVPAETIELNAQSQGYHTMLQACLLTPKCTSFTVWGFTDKYSWIPDWFEGEGAALLLDEQYNPKPAYKAVQQDLRLAARGR
ncbi:endo-1,4-beta-xylanase [Streptomyces macrosporus]|uniref:Beta-xylanase n=1 Tax=Streptomyces macrosporus TaxID=44032 RepID=A0ABP5X1D4_9ACTN